MLVFRLVCSSMWTVSRAPEQAEQSSEAMGSSGLLRGQKAALYIFGAREERFI
jgi:hypothetical protein